MVEASDDPARVGYPEYKEANSGRRGGRNAPQAGRPVTHKEMQHQPAGPTYQNRTEEGERRGNEWAAAQNLDVRQTDEAHYTSQQSLEALNRNDPRFQIHAGHTPSAPPVENPP
ncbi:unnamed protein product [Calypogeia fissa]